MSEPATSPTTESAAGSAHALLLKADGTVWLDGIYHRVHERPVPVTGLTGIVAIGASCIHNVAVGADGRIWAWSLRPFAPADGQPGAAWWRPVPVLRLKETGATPPTIGAIAAASSRTLAFGAGAATRTLTITNVGLAPLEIDQVLIRGKAAADFAVAAESCSGVMLYPGSSGKVEVRFTPGKAGRRKAHLLIRSNAMGGPLKVLLSGQSDQCAAGATGSGTTELHVPLELAVPVAVSARGKCGKPIVTAQDPGDCDETKAREYLVTIPVTVKVRTEAAGKTQVKRIRLTLTRRVRIDPTKPGATRQLTFLQRLRVALPLSMGAEAACHLNTVSNGDDP